LIKRTLFLKKFWFTCALFATLSGLLGIIAVLLDKFLFKEKMFTFFETCVFIILVGLGVCIWKYIYPRFRHISFMNHVNEQPRKLD